MHGQAKNRITMERVVFRAAKFYFIYQILHSQLRIVVLSLPIPRANVDVKKGAA